MADDDEIGRAVGGRIAPAHGLDAHDEEAGDDRDRSGGPEDFQRAISGRLGGFALAARPKGHETIADRHGHADADADDGAHDEGVDALRSLLAGPPRIPSGSGVVGRASLLLDPARRQLPA